MRTHGAGGVWGFYFKLCNALNVSGTERVLVENCHASRMSCECFYSQGPGRWKGHEPKKYTKALTFLRCSVTDAARNAFNNNDFAENTSVLYCRIVDVGGCSWEGASRFVRFIGNYVRNGGTVAMGNIGSREAGLEELGSAQHIIADNVFESGVPYGGCAVRAAVGATQVIIRNNLFVNFASSVIEHFDPETFRFTLRKPHDMKPGDRFEVFPPSANWDMHDNIITGCLQPVVLDSYGSETTLFRGNLVTREETAGVKAAVEVRGRFNLAGNHFSGFDEKDSSAVTPYTDPYGRVPHNIYRDNIFERCTRTIAPCQPVP
jgi:hypothetical protein